MAVMEIDIIEATAKPQALAFFVARTAGDQTQVDSVRCHDGTVISRCQYAIPSGLQVGQGADLPDFHVS